MRIMAGFSTLALAGCAAAATPGTDSVEAWLTLPDQSALLAQQSPIPFGGEGGTIVIAVDPAQRFQKIVGFGASITDASAWLIEKKMSPAQRDALLKDLFGPAPGINLSFTRLTVGASDFSRTDRKSVV